MFVPRTSLTGRASRFIPTAFSPCSVADVTDGDAEPTSFSRVDGEPSLAVAITKTPDGNVVEVSDEVAAALDDVADRLAAQDVTVTVVFDQAPFITESIEGLAGAAPRSVYLDLHAHYTAQERDNTPFTPAVQVLHAMRQALDELESEGVDARIDRYAANARVVRDGMAELGFEILVPAGARSNILTTFRLLPGLSYDALHDAMKRRGYVIYAGQGTIRTYAFRVSNMGTLTPADMKGVVDAFGSSLTRSALRRQSPKSRSRARTSGAARGESPVRSGTGTLPEARVRT